MQSRKISIHRTILIYLVLVGVISVLSVGYLWISSERSKFVTEANTLRTSYLEEQQKTLKREVNRALMVREEELFKSRTPKSSAIQCSLRKNKDRRNYAGFVVNTTSAKRMASGRPLRGRKDNYPDY